MSDKTPGHGHTPSSANHIATNVKLQVEFEGTEPGRLDAIRNSANVLLEKVLSTSKVPGVASEPSDCTWTLRESKRLDNNDYRC